MILPLLTCKCVRPILMMWSNDFRLASIASRRAVSLGSKLCLSSTTAEMCIAVGKLAQSKGRLAHVGDASFSTAGPRAGEKHNSDLRLHLLHSRVVGRGRHVDMVVGVDRLLAAHLTTQDLDGPVGDDLDN